MDVLECPICCKVGLGEKELTVHVNAHFEETNGSPSKPTKSSFFQKSKSKSKSKSNTNSNVSSSSSKKKRVSKFDGEKEQGRKWGCIFGNNGEKIECDEDDFQNESGKKKYQGNAWDQVFKKSKIEEKEKDLAICSSSNVLRRNLTILDEDQNDDYNDDDFDNKGWDCKNCTFRNIEDKVKCEICEFQRGNTSKESQVNAWGQVFNQTKTEPSAQTLATYPIAMTLSNLIQKKSPKNFKICHPSTTYYSQKFEPSWGCGYRNFQMLISSLLPFDEYKKLLFGNSGKVPDILDLQKSLEAAWKKGYDEEGAIQLGHHVVKTKKWIGATEIAAVLRSFSINAELIDYRESTTPEGSHPLLFQHVVEYFSSNYPMGNGKNHPVLYLQHEGHSRTIIGFEQLKNNNINLIILDPSTKKEQLDRAILNQDLRTFRYSLNRLKNKQYQIVKVVGVYKTIEEREESKNLSSISYP